MARASTKTLLPLDRWAAILGLEPRHFNGMVTVARPKRACHEVWLQYAWQASDRVGREDVAQAIAQAESDVIEALGYYPLPQWIDGEVVRTAYALDRTLVGSSGLDNPRGLFRSVQAAMGHIISGGVQSKTNIGTATRSEPAAPGDTMVLTDVDGDSYAEIARITLPTTVTDTNEVRCYFAGHNQEDEWEIRPLHAVTIAGGNVVIDVDRHLLVHPALWEALNAAEVDGDLVTNFELTVEVYQVANDPSQQAQMQWERVPNDCDCGSTTCASCAWGTQWACLQTRDPRLGIVTYQPATWNVTTGQYDAAALAVDRQPERVRLYYMAGYEWPRAARSWQQMDPLLERIITYYSVTLLDRPICSCDNVQTFIARWNEDVALVGDSRYQVGARDLACPWGTRAGAVWAWKQIQKMQIQKAVLY